MPMRPYPLPELCNPDKIRLLLVSANRVTTPYPVFPLGIAYLQAALARAGVQVKIWDPLVHAEDALESGLLWANAIGISMRNIDNVSAKAPYSYVDEFGDLIDRIRACSSAPLIVGGSAFSIFPQQLLQRFNLGWGIQGEGEAALCGWLQVLFEGKAAAAVPGLWYRSGAQVVGNPCASFALDTLPPALPANEWVSAYVAKGGMLNVQTQRGCIFNCTYCTYPWIEGRCMRPRNPAAVAAEIAHLQKAGVRYVFLTDSVFNTSEAHVLSVCDALLRHCPGIEWGCFARPQNLSDATLDRMIAAGMRHIEFGSDSFCDRTLRSYGKSFRFKDILETCERVADKSVHACHYIIFGGPGECATTIQETVTNSTRLPRSPIFAFSGMRIYPHTPLFKQSRTQLSYEQLLRPHFYENPDFPRAIRDSVVQNAVSGLSNWTLSDHADDHEGLTLALRRRGKQGPLWEYLDLMNRMQSGGSATSSLQS